MIREFTIICFLHLLNLSVTFSILVFLPSLVVITVDKFNVFNRIGSTFNIYQRVYGKRLLSISVLYYPFPEATSVSIILSILLDILGYISKYIAIMIYSPR